jgi:transcriptional regulator GlxA family with amidase domain
MAPRLVVIVAWDGVEILDVTGPASVFSTASLLAGDDRRGYRVEVVGLRKGPITAFGGIRLMADRALGELRGSIDTLVVAGSPLQERLCDDRLAAAIKRAAPRAARIAGVCTGAFVLARAGLLDGKRAATHWAALALMRQRHPAVRIEEDPIFIREGKLWTSAGVSAGIDLCLALVEQDHGRPFALQIARWMVLYLRRSGGQSQFSAPLAVQWAEREPVRELQTWIAEHLSADLGVEALARRAHMSVRNFARVFRQEVGVTPGCYVDAVRVEAARGALEMTRQPIKHIARETGFGTPATMAGVFRRRVGLSPVEVRQRFGLAPGERHAAS